MTTRKWYRCGCTDELCPCFKHDAIPEEHIQQTYNTAFPCVRKRLQDTDNPPPGACPFCGACLRPRESPAGKVKQRPDRVYTALLDTQLGSFIGGAEKREAERAEGLAMWAKIYPLPRAVWEMYPGEESVRLPGARASENVKEGYLSYTVYTAVNPKSGYPCSRLLFIPGVEESKTDPRYKKHWEVIQHKQEQEAFADAGKAFDKHQTRLAYKALHDAILTDAGHAEMCGELTLYGKGEGEKREKKSKTKGAGE